MGRVFLYTWPLLNDRLRFFACVIVWIDEELNSNLGPPSRIACSVLSSPHFPPCSSHWWKKFCPKCLSHHCDEYLSIMFTCISLISSLSSLSPYIKLQTNQRWLSPCTVSVHDQISLTKKRMNYVASIQINEWLLLMGILHWCLWHIVALQNRIMIVISKT